jgi:hypothetical protein
MCTWTAPAAVGTERRPTAYVKGHADLNSGGRETWTVVDNRTERWWPPDLPGGVVVTGRVVGSGQGFYLLSGEGLGESDAVAAGLAEVGVV